MKQGEQKDGVDDAYALTPLATRPRCVRLLRVEAALREGGLQDDTDPIRGTLIEEDLDTHPRYAALSYVWGNASAKKKAILISDNIFHITENCYAALWHLRYLLGQYSIWIDAICINQDDELEKLTQISLMEIIYKQADQVYAWLGPHDSFAADSVHLLANAAFRTQFDRTQVDPSSNRSAPSSMRLMAWRVAFNLYFERLRPRESPWARFSKRKCIGRNT